MNPHTPMIMLVDDFPSTLMILEKMLKRANYQVRTFASGKEALDAVEDIKPDLILLDIQMPEMDGFEVCKRLKEIPRLASIPVLFLSAADEAMDKVKAFNSGAADYLTKPYHPAEIMSRVGVYLKVQSLQDELDRLKDGAHETRLKDLEELMDEFNHILIRSGQSPMASLTNCLNSLKSSVPGKLNAEEMTNLDGAVVHSSNIARLFQKCLQAVSAQARTK